MRSAFWVDTAQGIARSTALDRAVDGQSRFWFGTLRTFPRSIPQSIVIVLLIPDVIAHMQIAETIPSGIVFVTRATEIVWQDASISITSSSATNAAEES